MIGAFDAASTAANTPRTLVARLSPARTLSGSVVATPTAGQTIVQFLFKLLTFSHRYDSNGTKEPNRFQGRPYHGHYF